jgi:hypothetical protein
MKLTIKIENSKEFFMKVKNFGQVVEDLVEEEVAMAIDNVYNRAQAAVPTTVEGGINLRATAYKEVVKLQGEVGYASVMAAYYEFGTGAYVDIRYGLEDYAQQFFVNGRGRIPANAFLFPALFSVKKEFKEEVLKGIHSKWVK